MSRIEKISDHTSVLRLNDGRAGPDGRFWAGSMAEQGVAKGAMAPGALFHATAQPCTLMRINFATTQDAAFWRLFERRVAAQRGG